MTSDKTELRGLCPTELAQALDAIAQSEGLDRNTYVIQVLDKHVRDIAHKQIMLSRMLKGNPYLAQAVGSCVE